MAKIELSDAQHCYSVADIRALEKHAIEQQGVSSSELMAAAGKAAFDAIQRAYPPLQSCIYFVAVATMVVMDLLSLGWRQMRVGPFILLIYRLPEGFQKMQLRRETLRCKKYRRSLLSFPICREKAVSWSMHFWGLDLAES